MGESQSSSRMLRQSISLPIKHAELKAQTILTLYHAELKEAYCWPSRLF
jgi:hypothetical protein